MRLLIERCRCCNPTRSIAIILRGRNSQIVFVQVVVLYYYLLTSCSVSYRDETRVKRSNISLPRVGRKNVCYGFHL